MSLIRPAIFAAGAAHLDRRGRPSGPYRAGASNPGTMVESVGGAVLNAALAMRLFDADVRLCSGRGGDAAADHVAEALEAAGIEDLSLVWLDRATPTYTAILDHHGDLVAGIADMALYDIFKPRLFQRRHLREAMAASGGLLLDANLPEAAIAGLLHSFADRPSAAIGVSPSKASRLSAFLPRLSALFLSRAEAALLAATTPETLVAGLARRLAEAGARRAVVTDGPHDAAILDGESLVLQTPPAVAALRDVTGAGDTLAGVAFQATVAGMTFTEAARLGMAAASRRISAEAVENERAADRIREIAASMAPCRAIAD